MSSTPYIDCGDCNIWGRLGVNSSTLARSRKTIAAIKMLKCNIKADSRNRAKSADKHDKTYRGITQVIMLNRVAAQVSDELRKFSKPAWDMDEDTEPVSDAALKLVDRLLASLGDIDKPAVTPLPDGSVGLFWATNGVHLQIDVFAGGGASYYFRVPTRSKPETGEVGQDNGNIEVLVGGIYEALPYITVGTEIAVGYAETANLDSANTMIAFGARA